MHKFEPSYTVNDIQSIERRGPWRSKSGGSLEVLFAMTQAERTAFFDDANPEFDRLPGNQRGLRQYTVSGIPEGSVGGLEWHRARTEFVAALVGAAVWECIDFEGNERTFTLDGSTAVITPPGILHTYHALEPDTRLQVVCNTLFIPEDPTTHDTYTRDSFYELRAEDRL